MKKFVIGFIGVAMIGAAGYVVFDFITPDKEVIHLSTMDRKGISGRTSAADVSAQIKQKQKLLDERNKNINEIARADI